MASSTPTTSNKRPHSAINTIDDITTKLDQLQRDIKILTNSLDALEQQTDNSTEEHLRNTDTLDTLSRKIDTLTQSFQTLNLNPTHTSRPTTSSKLKKQTFTVTLTNAVNTARHANNSTFQPPTLTNYITDTITILTLLNTNSTSNIPYVNIWEAFLAYQNDSSLSQSIKTRTRKAFVNTILQNSNDSALTKILKRTDLFATAKRCYLFASLFPGTTWRDAFEPKQMKLFSNNEAEEFCFQFENNVNLMM